MNSIAGRLGLALTAAIVAIPAAAWAGDTCHGYSIGNNRDRVLIHLQGVVPMHLAKGECGEGSTGKPGEMTNECTYTDGDGDQWTSRNNWTAGASEGKWCNVRGTGKYEKVMGGCGWWKTVVTSQLYAWEFGGQCLITPPRK